MMLPLTLIWVGKKGRECGRKNADLHGRLLFKCIQIYICIYKCIQIYIHKIHKIIWNKINHKILFLLKFFLIQLLTRRTKSCLSLSFLSPSLNQLKKMQNKTSGYRANLRQACQQGWPYSISSSNVHWVKMSWEAQDVLSLNPSSVIILI